MRMILAHHWAFLKNARIRRFPNKTGDKRDLNVTINSWIGTSPGAKHYYAIVEEEKNSWWCEAENAWVQLSCDGESSGYSMSAEVLTESEAVTVALFFVTLIAGTRRPKHRVIWSGPGRPRWAQ